MAPIRLLGLSLLAAALVAACGGSDQPYVPGSGVTLGAPATKGSFRALVTFGDSLSDIGTYAPATSIAGNGQAPYLGGKFTTNGPDGTVWVENLAASLGLVVTPAEVGFAGTSVKCPAAASPALASTCTAYAQGGARVTNPSGIGRAGGALTVPVVTQIANHLARFGSFKDSDLILAYAGSNDVFAQFGAFSTKATQIQTAAARGQISADEASAQLFAAQTEAQYGMKQAALELAGYVREQIVAKGGRYVGVMTLSDIADTPFGSTVPASARPVLSDLSRIFNLWLREGLVGAPVQIVDTFPLLKDLYQNPGRFGFVNNTGVACDGAKIAALTGNRITDGTSLFCNATPGVPFNTLRSGASTTTWAFADGVHPTSGGHRALSDAFRAQLQSFGWI